VYKSIAKIMTGGTKRGQSPTNEDISSSSKKVKTEPCDIIWEWEDDEHSWTPFTKNLKKEVEEGFKGGLQKMKVKINDVSFDIIFDRMVQRNAKTFWERRIRANVNKEDGGISGSYHYKTDDETFELYDHNIQRLIYAANCYKISKVNYTLKRQKYTIDLDKLEQINVKTKTIRKISATGENEGESINENNDNENESSDNSYKPSSSTNGTVKVKKEKDVETIKETKSEVKPLKSKNKKVVVKDEKPIMKSISFKGKAPVDSECPQVEKYNVFYEGTNVYDAMLNQTNLKYNNNKFFLLQVLQSNSKTGYAVWLRWGRVGNRGQTNFINCGNDLEEAKEIFCKKFYDKTLNEFSDRKKFRKEEGKYDLLKMDYKSEEKESMDTVDGPDSQSKDEKLKPESKLDKKLQAIVEIICNVKEMEDAIVEMKFDTKKAPLGKLTKDQIKAGYKALKLIDKCITSKETGNELIEACDAFYTRVPHCFGMKRPPVIKTRQEVKLKIELLDALGDIEIAMKILKNDKNTLLNPIDQHYKSLNCEMNILLHESAEFKMVEKYTQNTHAKTHNQYKMQVVDVLEVKDQRRINEFKDIGNRMLLYHGSRLTNWCGILGQGLRIAPPEAPVTGYMFGKGVYFADMSSKSANYCYPTRSKNFGFVLLCEVALGETNDLLVADYEANNLPNGCHSTKGLGKIAPNKEEYLTLPDGMVVPLGCPSDTGVNNPNGFTLNYNEYVVYNTNQIKPRYLVQLKFLFK